MSNQLNFFIFFSLAFSLSTFAAKKTALPATPPLPSSFTSMPKIQKNEYAVFVQDAYIVFKTKEFQKFELATNCFKKDKPKCEALSAAQAKPPEVKITNKLLDNMAAINCKNIGGKNLLALDFKRNEYNFCRFGDGSMVNSWTAYWKYHPVAEIK